MTLPTWVRERFALHALEYPIPARANRLDFMLGAVTLAALTILAVTGIVLTQFYNPTPLGAHESLRYIITRTSLAPCSAMYTSGAPRRRSYSSSPTSPPCSGGGDSGGPGRPCGGAGCCS